MYCEKCATQLPDQAAFCHSCGKPTSNALQVASSAPEKGTSSKTTLWVLLISLVSLVAIGSLVVQFTRPHAPALGDSAAHSLAPTPLESPLPPRFVHHDQNPLAGSVAVNAHSIYSVAFTLLPDVQNVHVTGHFQTYGGMQNDIQAVLCSDEDFVNFKNGHQARVFYNSGKTTVADINATLPPAPGRYVLAFNNNFSLLSGKTVSGEVTLSYDAAR